jgi:hypothetical protein
MTTLQPNRYGTNAVRDTGHTVREFASELAGGLDAETRAELDSWHPSRVRELYFGNAPRRPHYLPHWEPDSSVQRRRGAGRIYKLVGIVILVGIAAITLVS